MGDETQLVVRRTDNVEPLDLEEFSWKLRVRQLTLDDFDALIAMQQKCFPGMQPWGRDQIESQLAIFPKGQLCIECDGQLVASSSSLILDYDPKLAWHDWKAIADGGLPAQSQPERGHAVRDRDHGRSRVPGSEVVAATVRCA